MSCFTSRDNLLQQPNMVWKKLKLHVLGRSKLLQNIRTSTLLSCFNCHHKNHQSYSQSSVIPNPGYISKPSISSSGTTLNHKGSTHRLGAKKTDHCHDNDDEEEEEEDGEGEEEGDKSNGMVVVQLHGVDARAEEFIKSFHERLKLERDQSTREFYEMLARAT